RGWHHALEAARHVDETLEVRAEQARVGGERRERAHGGLDPPLALGPRGLRASRGRGAHHLEGCRARTSEGEGATRARRRRAQLEQALAKAIGGVEVGGHGVVAQRRRLRATLLHRQERGKELAREAVEEERK